jgi:hypothetical protein
MNSIAADYRIVKSSKVKQAKALNDNQGGFHQVITLRVSAS